MKRFAWDPQKSQLLKESRGVSFEDVVFYLERGALLDELEHPNADRYPGQRILVVDIERYAYCVPFVEDETTVFLKTIFPSRKLTKRYLQGEPS